MRFGVIGAGCVGLYTGCRLLAQGHDVVFLGRPRVRDEVLQHGVSLTSVAHPGERISLSSGELGPRFFTDSRSFAEYLLRDSQEKHDDGDLEGPAAAEAAGPGDDPGCVYFLLCVKRLQTAQTLDELRPWLDARGATGRPLVWVPLQNGVGSDEDVARLCPQHVVLGAMFPFAVNYHGPGAYRQGSLGAIYVSEHERFAQPLVNAFIQCKLDACTHPDIRNVLYGKLLINLNNSINALCNLPIRAEFVQKPYRALLSWCISEALQCYAAEGIRPVSFTAAPPSWLPYVLVLPNWIFLRLAQAMLRIDEDAHNSMWEDLRSRREETEVRFLNGEIVRLGEKHGIATPYNRTLAALIERVAPLRRGNPTMSAEQLQGVVQGHIDGRVDLQRLEVDPQWWASAP